MHDSHDRGPRSVSELLGDLRYGPIQSAGSMDVVPLLRDSLPAGHTILVSPFDDCFDPAAVRVVAPYSLACAPPGGHRRVREWRLDLANLVATFECIVDQVGAIVLVDEVVVGVEVGPSDAYWELTWPVLVRRLYGLLAVEAALKAGPDPDPVSESESESDRESDRESEWALGRLVAEIERQSDERVLGRIREISAAPLRFLRVARDGPLERIALAGSGYRGEVRREGGRLVAASLVADSVLVRAGIV